MSGRSSEQPGSPDAHEGRSCRSAHPSASIRLPSPPCPHCAAPVCTPAVTIRWQCENCGVVVAGNPGDLRVDPEATRAALVVAADACAGRWNLHAILDGPEISDPGMLEAYHRLGLAESGVAAVARMTL